MRIKLRFNAHFETLKKVEGEVRLESAKFVFCFISEVFLAPSEGPSSLQIFLGLYPKAVHLATELRQPPGEKDEPLLVPPRGRSLHKGSNIRTRTSGPKRTQSASSLI